MKKILASALVLLVGTALATAEMTVGLKGTLAVTGNTWGSDLKETMEARRKAATDGGAEDKRPAAILGGGGSVFFRYDFVNLGLSDALGLTVGVQPEVGFHANFGTEEKSSGSFEAKFSYNTLDLPLMIVVGLKIKENFKVSLSVGPNFGFAVGKGKVAVGETTEVELKPFLMGLQAGLGFGYNFTRNHGIILDARFLTDFRDVEVKPGAEYVKAARRMGALLSLGYAFTF